MKAERQQCSATLTGPCFTGFPVLRWGRKGERCPRFAVPGSHAWRFHGGMAFTFRRGRAILPPRDKQVPCVLEEERRDEE